MLFILIPSKFYNNYVINTLNYNQAIIIKDHKQFFVITLQFGEQKLVDTLKMSTSFLDIFHKKSHIDFSLNKC